MCHRWEAEKHTPIDVQDFLNWCDTNGFVTHVEEHTLEGDMRLTFYKHGEYKGAFVAGMFAPGEHPEVWYWEDDTASNHLTLTSVEELNQH